MISIKFRDEVSGPGPDVGGAYDRLLQRQDIGFFKILEREREGLWASSQRRAEVIRGQADQFLFIGIGGSSLGVRALLKACPQQRDQFLFLENVDEVAFLEVCALIQDFKRLHVVFTSKSGGTLETLTIFEFLRREFQTRGLSMAKQCTVISELTANPLSDWARSEKVEILEIPKDVGGRFSALSPVGFLPAALALGSLESVRAGVQWAFEKKDLVQTLVRQSLKSFERDEWLTVLWHYSDAMSECGLWWQQLWAESLAKTTTRAGAKAPRVSTPLVVRGAQDQHSLLQQFMEGERDKWFWFFELNQPAKVAALSEIEIKSPWPLAGQTFKNVIHAEMEATRSALHDQGISWAKFVWSEFSPKSVAGYFMMMQLVVGTLGEVFEINAYDQPGVELGKRRAREILARQF